MTVRYARTMKAAMGMIAVGLAILLGACGESDCEKFGNQLCDMACACTAGNECAVSQGGVTITSDSPSDCRGFWVTLGCMGGGDDTFDYPGCLSLLENAQCVDTGGGVMAVEIPDAPECMSQN